MLLKYDTILLSIIITEPNIIYLIQMVIVIIIFLE